MWIIIDIQTFNEKFNLNEFIKKYNISFVNQKNIYNGIILNLSKKEIDEFRNMENNNEISLFFNKKIKVKNIFKFVIDNFLKTCNIFIDKYNSINAIDRYFIDAILNEKEGIDVNNNNIKIKININLPESSRGPTIDQLTNLTAHGFINPVLIRGACNKLQLDHYHGSIKTNNYYTNQCLHLIKNNLNPYNSMIFKIDKTSINHLKYTPFSACTINKNKTCTQKEMAGSFEIIDVTEKGVYTLGIIPKSIIYGDEEGVPIVNSHYNFHSHPEEAYIAHNVINGIPSAQDYIGYIDSVYKNKTRCHFVAAIEGIYIISISKHHKIYPDVDSYFNQKNIFFNFIKNKYDESKFDNNISPEQYTTYINTIKYNEKKIFDLQFLDWNSFFEKKIKIYYMCPYE
jgi:hypothetical protein